MECPICLNDFQESDKKFPLKCCQYNFCRLCISNLIESSNSSKKIPCPQCRQDLGWHIQSVITLRNHEDTLKYKTIPDSQLSAKELQIKFSYEENKNDVEEALRIYNEFVPGTENGSAKSSHSKVNNNRIEFVDSALFGGIEIFMSETEREYVNQLMTSGDAGKLAQATQILASVLELTKKGLRPVVVESNPSPNSTRSNNSRGVGRRHASAATRALAMNHSEERSEFERHMAAIKRHRALHPLPVRMPRCITFENPSNNIGLKFIDDEWDGTIADAFCRMQINSRKNTIVKKTKLQGRDGESEELVKKMLGSDNYIANAQHQAEPKKRVVVANVRGHAGKLGVQKGDVITHLNNETFEGTAQELDDMIETYTREGLTFSIILNAEDSVAEALRLRSLMKLPTTF